MFNISLWSGQEHHSLTANGAGLISLAPALPDHRLFVTGESGLILTQDAVLDCPKATMTTFGDFRLRWTRREVARLSDSTDPTPLALGAQKFTVACAGHPTKPLPSLAVAGRHPECHIQLTSRRASQFHAAVETMAGCIRFWDLGSTNGVWIGGSRVQQSTIYGSARVVLGDEVIEVSSKGTSDSLLDLPSAQSKQLNHFIRRIAPASAPVVIAGESGVGKEGIARKLHAMSGRQGPFVAINAATLSPTLGGSQLFGHCKGAFTGADNDRAGVFEMAHGGTLFLDEVGELDLGVQAELLRALESRQIRRIGEHHPRPVDVRIVAATHRNLKRAVAAHQFREDLFHRIWVLPLEVTPLRERPEDIIALLEFFLDRQDPPRRVSKETARWLSNYAWPGNVRELRNVVERAAATHDQRLLHRSHFRLMRLCEAGKATLPDQRILRAYRRLGSAQMAAEHLGIHRSTVYRCLRRNGEHARKTPLEPFRKAGHPFA